MSPFCVGVYFFGVTRLVLMNGQSHIHGHQKPNNQPTTTTNFQKTMAMSRLLRPLIAVFGAIALASPFIFKLDRLPSSAEDHSVTRRLDIAIDDSDPLATATISVVSRQDPPPAISPVDHKKLSEILSETRKLIVRAKSLL